MGRRWTSSAGDRAATAALGVVAVSGATIVLVLLLQLLGFRADKAVRLGLTAVPVLAVAFLFAGAVYRRFRFSLKSLLIFYLLCGAGLTLVVRQNVAWHADEKAIEGLLQAGGRLEHAEPAAPGWLQELIGHDYVGKGPIVHAMLVPRETFFLADSMLQPLARLPTLRTLEIRGPKLTDAGLENLRHLPHLERLNLACVPVTDAGLQHLAQLGELQELRLDSTRITDDGLRHLENLQKLETLSLDGSGITDRGLEHFRHLSRLKHVSLQDTLVSEAGAAALREALPEAEISAGTRFPRSQRVAVERIRELGGSVRVSVRTR